MKLNFIIGSITNILPFSLFEINLIGFLLISIILIVKLIKNAFKKDKNKLIKHTFSLIIYALILSNTYISICGIAYQREKVDIKLYEGEITPSLVDDTISYYLNDYNNIIKEFDRDENNITINPYSFKELSLIMQKECEKLNESDYFYKFTGRPKATWFSPILSELHITGVDFPFTAEANINHVMPSIDIPFVMAHEIAHLKGVMREDDANLVALYVCIRYSGYFRGFSRLLEIKAYTNNKEYKEVIQQMDPRIFLDNSNYSTYFKEHDLLQDLSTFINDIYLYINGEKEGTSSYIDTSITESTGKVDDEGNEIRYYKNYSPYQKLLVQKYLNSL